MPNASLSSQSRTQFLCDTIGSSITRLVFPNRTCMHVKVSQFDTTCHKVAITFYGKTINDRRLEIRSKDIRSLQIYLENMYMYNICDKS